MIIPKLLVSGLLLAGSGWAQSTASQGLQPIEHVSLNERTSAIDLHIESRVTHLTANEPKRINCTEVQKGGRNINCTGLSHKECRLRFWLWVGCHRSAECATATGVEAKHCCDNRRILPFGAGVYYTGYMRACAPQYQLKKFDQPAFQQVACADLDDYDCEDANHFFCDMRSWEHGGCHQREICKRSKEDRATCCAGREILPQGHLQKFYRSVYDKRCLAD